MILKNQSCTICFFIYVSCMKSCKWQYHIILKIYRLIFKFQDKLIFKFQDKSSSIHPPFLFYHVYLLTPLCFVQLSINIWLKEYFYVWKYWNNYVNPGIPVDYIYLQCWAETGRNLTLHPKGCDQYLYTTT